MTVNDHGRVCPCPQNLNQARRRRAEEQKAEDLLNLPLDEMFRRGDHINQYGLPNDSYDYSSHFKEMGGGKFLSASGRVADPGIQARRIELPEEVLPGQDMDRMLEHVTISESECQNTHKSTVGTVFVEYGILQ